VDTFPSQPNTGRLPGQTRHFLKLPMDSILQRDVLL